MPPRILVLFDLSDPVPVSARMAERLAATEIVVLGHYPVPEQTPNEVAREQFDEEAEEQLADLALPFEDAGATVTYHLSFGKAPYEAVAAVMDEEDCIAEFEPAPRTEVDDVLVPVPQVEEADRLPAFVSLLTADTPQEITLFHVVEEDWTRAEGEDIVAESRERIVDAGIDPSLARTRITEGGRHGEELLRVAGEYDAVIMYAPQPRLADVVLGDLSSRIRDATNRPVVVLRRDY